MLEEEILNSVWRKYSDSIFTGKTYSKGRLGFTINYSSPNLMNITGGNLDLPNYVELQLGDKVRYYFNDDKYFSQKRGYRKDNFGILDKLDMIKRNEVEGPDENWQILRLLDPRVLFKNGTYKIWGSVQEKLLKITLEHDLSKLQREGVLKISNEFLEWLISERLEKRISIAYVDNNHNLYKLSQKEITIHAETVSTYYRYSKTKILERKPITV